MAIKTTLIKSLNLSIQPGTRIALVGGSGSGKSTLAKLIAGLHQPSSGEILFDGKPLLKIPRSVSVGSLAMVQQEIQLFGCSVRDNLSLWNSTIRERDLNQACRDAEILDVVRALPDGFETKLSEGGQNLSGGQRQRLELARALVGNPSILVMDEAASALDAETEQRIIQNLSRRGCTPANRGPLVEHHPRCRSHPCNVDQGQVIEQGKHRDLIRNDHGTYAQLLKEAQ